MQLLPVPSSLKKRSESPEWEGSGHELQSLFECLGCHIFFYDPMVTRQTPSAWKRVDSIEDLVECSDIVSIHATPQADGSPLIDANVLSHANGITLINTARGTLIDEQSLISALSSGKVKAAALDVFPSEPYSGGSFHSLRSLQHRMLLPIPLNHVCRWRWSQ